MAYGTQTQSISFVDATTLTIASGVVTATQTRHTIAAQTGTTDDLDTINPITLVDATYSTILFIKADAGDTITLKHGTGNIYLSSGGDLAVSGNEMVALVYDGSNWNDVTVSATGSASPLNTKGDIYGYSTTDDRLPVGSNDQVLIADSAQSLGIKWGTAAIAGGGTGQTTKTAAFDALSPVTTRGDIIVKDASNNVALALGTNNKALVSDGTDLGYELVSVVSSQAGTPSSTPATVGEVNIDTTNDRAFIATDTSANTDWKRSDAGMVLIASGEVTADAASVTLSSLVLDNREFYAWKIIASGLESDVSAATDNILVQFNSDTTATNYNSVNQNGTGSGNTNTEIIGTLSGLRLLQVCAATTTDSGAFGNFEMTIFQPQSTGDKKHAIWLGHLSSETSGELRTTHGGGHWESTSAITSITVLVQNGTTFLVGGAGEPQRLSVRLYGLY